MSFLSGKRETPGWNLRAASESYNAAIFSKFSLKTANGLRVSILVSTKRFDLGVWQKKLARKEDQPTQIF